MYNFISFFHLIFISKMVADNSVALGQVQVYVNDIWALLPEFVERRAGPMSRQAERCSFNKSPLMIKRVTDTVTLELDGPVLSHTLLFRECNDLVRKQESLMEISRERQTNQQINKQNMKCRLLSTLYTSYVTEAFSD